MRESKALEMAEAVNPGFINLKVSGDFLAQYLQNMKNSRRIWVWRKRRNRKRWFWIMADQIWRHLHVGHLRSQLWREHQENGKISGKHGDVHLGDWGLQMGLIITELQKDSQIWCTLMKIIRENIRRKRRSPLENWKITLNGKSKEDEAYKAEAGSDS